MSDYIKRKDALDLFGEQRLLTEEEQNDYNAMLCKKADDYIKREDAINTIRNTFTGMTADTLELRINDIPSADVAPVRHGRWIVGERMPMYDIKGNLSWGNWYTCNQCEFKTYAIEGHITQYRYCPNCGAKMDEGGTDGTDDR